MFVQLLFVPGICLIKLTNNIIEFRLPSRQFHFYILAIIFEFHFVLHGFYSFCNKAVCLHRSTLRARKVVELMDDI